MKIIQLLILMSITSCSIFIPYEKPLQKRVFKHRPKLTFRKMERRDKMSCVRGFIEIGVKPLEANDVCKEIFE